METKSNTFCLYERKNTSKYSTIITLTKSVWSVLFVLAKLQMFVCSRRGRSAEGAAADSLWSCSGKQHQLITGAQQKSSENTDFIVCESLSKCCKNSDDIWIFFFRFDWKFSSVFIQSLRQPIFAFQVCFVTFCIFTYNCPRVSLCLMYSEELF